MRYILIIQIIFLISCYLQPEDCNGVLGGTAEIDDCGGCIGGDTGKEACEDLDQDKFDDGDMKFLSDLKDLRPSLTEVELINIGQQSWLGGRLINFHFPNNSDNSKLPESIGNLTNLTSLNLYDNNLTGSIPPQIGNLVNLNYLYLSIFYYEQFQKVKNMFVDLLFY